MLHWHIVQALPAIQGLAGTLPALAHLSRSYEDKKFLKEAINEQ